jgi:hypothetical protein
MGAFMHGDAIFGAAGRPCPTAIGNFVIAGAVALNGRAPLCGPRLFLFVFRMDAYGFSGIIRPMTCLMYSNPAEVMAEA